MIVSLIRIVYFFETQGRKYGRNLSWSCLKLIVQELAIKKRHQAYRIAAIVHIAHLKPKS